MTNDWSATWFASWTGTWSAASEVVGFHLDHIFKLVRPVGRDDGSNPEEHVVDVIPQHNDSDELRSLRTRSTSNPQEITLALIPPRRRSSDEKARDRQRATPLKDRGARHVPLVTDIDEDSVSQSFSDTWTPISLDEKSTPIRTRGARNTSAFDNDEDSPSQAFSRNLTLTPMRTTPGSRTPALEEMDRDQDSTSTGCSPRFSRSYIWTPWRNVSLARSATPMSTLSRATPRQDVARHALEGLRNISKATANRQYSWKAVEARFDELALEDGTLCRSDFAACIGMKDSEEFAGELLDALTRRKALNVYMDKLSKPELHDYWRQIVDTSFDARMQLFFDLCDKDSDGCIAQEGVREVILLSASANKLSILPEQAEEYAALIMEELDRHHRGYIELTRLETLMTPQRSKNFVRHPEENLKSPLIPTLERTRLQRYSTNFNLYLQEHSQRIVIVALWIGANVGVFTWKFIQFRHRASFKIMGYCVCTAKGGAEMCKLNFALILLPVCRITITWLRSTSFGSIIPFDDNINFHKLIATGVVLGALVHILPQLSCNFPRMASAKYDIFMETIGTAFHGKQPSIGDLLITTAAITGITMTVLVIIIFFLAWDRSRKSLAKLHSPFNRLAGFNSFWYSHHLLVLVYGLLIVHGWFLILSTRWDRKMTWAYVALPMVLYFCERCLRAFRAGHYKVSILKAAVHSGNVLALQMTKPAGFKYISGMYIFLQCPSISKFEWHPFSITSAPRDDFLGVHVRSRGDWTTELKKLYTEALKLGTDDAFPDLHIDGPYGAPSQDYRKYDALLLVGLGIGATPFIGILRDMLKNMEESKADSKPIADSMPRHDPRNSTSRSDSFTIRDMMLRPRTPRGGFLKDSESKSKRPAFCGPTSASFYWVTREQGSFEWFKGIMNEVAEADGDAVIELHNYLTSVYEEGDARSALITMLQALHHAKSGGVDIVSGTRVRTHFARPDWRKVFAKLAAANPNSTVGVFYCGALPVGKQLRALSRKFSKESTTKFEFHKENF